MSAAWTVTEFACCNMSHRGPTQKIESGEASSLATVLLDCLSAGLVIVGGREQIVCCTPEAERLLHLPPGQIVGCELSVLPPAIQKITREAAATKQPVASRVITFATGRDAPVFRLGAFPFPAGRGKIQIVVTVNDVTIVRRIEQNLNRLDRLASLGTLSAGMAHEIKNAFVAVKTFVDLLLEKNRDAELGDVVGREMRRIDAIVSQMLKFGGPGRPAFAPVRVHDVLEHSLRMLQPQFEGKLISLNREFAAASDSIRGDDYQLEQAFVNLFFNALEAMGPNGALTVATDVTTTAAAHPAPHSPARFVRVTVSDNGIGIAPENMSRLFEPFFTTKQNGTGLGLAIARRIVREHHGDISATSEPNKGTAFRILLPAHPSAH
jgi:signal transduction histidine kinase